MKMKKRKSHKEILATLKKPDIQEGYEQLYLLGRKGRFGDSPAHNVIAILAVIGIIVYFWWLIFKFK